MKDLIDKYKKLKMELHTLHSNTKMLEVGCIVTTNGGRTHRIAEIGFGCSEGVAENCFYHWDKFFPYDIEHAAMDPQSDTIIDVVWPEKP
jgi:hypothetical protein